MVDLPIERLPDLRRRRAWTAILLLTLSPMLFSLAREMWEAPFPISETVAILESAGVMSDSRTSAHPLLDPTMVEFVDPNTRSWYRPLYWLTWWGFWHATHSIDTTLLLFRLLEVFAVIFLVLGCAWVLNPKSAIEYAAAVAAIGVCVAVPAFRVNLEIPLLMTLVGMCFALAAWMLIEREHGWWHGPALVLLTALAVGYKEQGLVLAPIVVAAWWVGAPGVRRGAAIAVSVFTVAYLVMRFNMTGSWSTFEQEVGLGFVRFEPSEAAERFGSFPYWIYAYSAAAVVSNVLFSEPTDGSFWFIRGLLDREAQAWQWNQVLTSTATTVLIAWWAVRAWRRDPAGHWSPESRLVVALVLALLASGALGFNYARDRLGGMAVIFYGIAAFYAFREAGWAVARSSGARIVAGSLVLLLLSAGWQVRMIGTIGWVYNEGHRAYRTWITNRQALHVDDDRNERYLQILDALEPQGIAPIRGHSYEW